MVISWLVEHLFGALHTFGLVPGVPTPFNDRLAKLDPYDSTLDNDVYNNDSFDWAKSGLELLNPVRVGYFMDKLHRRISSLDASSKQQPITILDLGCGAGLAIEAIHSCLIRSSKDPSKVKITKNGINDGEVQYKLIGIDMSARSIELARQRAESRSMSISYIVGDIYDLQLDTNSIDAIICSDVLEHIFDLPCAFSSISRVLKPNGIFSFDTINRTPTSYYLSIFILQDILKAMQGDVHDHKLYVTPDEVHGVMQAAGLRPGPKKDLVGMRPGIRFPPMGLYRFMTGQGFVSSFLAEFRLTSDLSISYLHWCDKASSLA
ncbi:related to COQ3 - O-methyltransferase involved in ubiquinone biosynthesis [Melanopsichium pennsylvanicum]|uniref:Related to COQ3 - O-methyltransferase involved in ubiquinone biosynthesis n=2 Tax=Melanopsichium pennsylvanicum TaxID=63383 RepID=A0AAJ5C8N0_9BASI|nr:conserved hypothetical protein [Melanopsichium pennsylvanicum 4]SNX87674.1 related to COQ3 - O-methyltransferase involved in ubiquinone biosynthesis [Melanopsichium pennsylvanicum]